MSLEEVQITPWELDNNFGITKSSVDKQDEYTLEDLTDNYKSAIGNFNGKTLLNTGLQFLSQTYVGQAANYVKGQLGKAGVAVNDSTRPVNTVSQAEDTLGADFKTLKNNKYKNIKLTSKLGQYNNMTNLLGNASGVLVGTLGKSAVTNVADSMLGGFLNSLPFGSLASKAISTTTKIVQSVKETKEKDSTVISTLTPTGKDLIALTAANYYSILTNKPGLTIRSHGNRLEHITGNKNEAPLETDREKEVREKNTKKDSTTAKSIRNNLISKKRNSDYETLIDDAAVIDTEIKRPSNLKEYVTGLFSSKDPLEENKIDKTSEAVGTPNKTDLEEEVKLINNKKFRPVEYITNTNAVSSSSDGTIGLISTEELDKFIQNYKFFNKTSGKDGTYNTNSELNGTTLSTKNTGIKKSTVINSILRKEVDIGPNYQLNSIEEVANYKGNDELIGTDNNYGRIGVANIYNRVNDTYRRIGGLYVEPFYNGVGLNCFEIPFEFNLKIEEANNQADYNTSEIMGRIIKVNSYKSSTPGTISITTNYYATSDDGDNNSSNGWLNGWMKDWTPEKLAKVERQYRALTLPYIKDGNFVKPPLVRIKMRSISSGVLGTSKADKVALKNTDGSTESKESLTVGDLFRYPSVEGRMQITEHFDGSTRDKRYIVKSVQINKLDDSFANSYGYFDISVGNYRSVKRRGFQVNITLEETTKNFLDLIPNYYEYTKGITDDPIESSDYDEDFKFVPAELSDIWSCLDQKIAFKVNNKVLVKVQTQSSDGTKDNANKPFIVYTTSDRWYYILQTDGDNTTSTYAAHYPENPPKEGELSTMISGAFNSDKKVYSSFAYKTENTIEENSETNDLLDPEAYRTLPAEYYTSLLKDEEGLSIKEIINLLKNTSWESNEGYKKWLWKGGNKFTGNWVEYYKILKAAGYEDSEIIKNTFNEYWKNKKEYKEWLILSTKYINNCYDADIKFGELIKIAKEVNEGMATIISSFKGSKYDTDGSGYNRWLGYTTWYEGCFDNFNILYNCMERAGYSKDEMDCLLQEGWGNYDYLKLKADKGYWEVFKDEAEILLRRMSIEEYVSLYKERESNFSWKKLIEVLSKTNKSTSKSKDCIDGYRTFVLNKMYEEKLDFYSPLSKDKDKIVYYILSNYYSDGQIKYLCENTDFANYSIEYKAWLKLTKAQREEIEYEDSFEGYNFYNDEEAKDVDKTETTNAVEEDNTDLNFEEVDYWKNEDVDAIQMFVHFFKNSDDDNNYLATTITDLVNVKEDSIKSLMEFPKDTSKAYTYDDDNKKVKERDAIK